MAGADPTATKPRRQCDINREARARRARTCEQCGVAFQERGLSSKEIREGKKRRFCSTKCRGDSQRVHVTKADAKRAYQYKRRARLGKPVLPPRAVVECATCNAPFMQSQPFQECCSPSCRVRLTQIRKVGQNSQVSSVRQSIHCIIRQQAQVSVLRGMRTPERQGPQADTRGKEAPWSC